MPIKTFAFVVTGGKTRGCEKGRGVGVGVGVPIGLEVVGTAPSRTLIVARAAVSASTKKALAPIPTVHESLVTNDRHHGLGAGVGRGRGVGGTLGAVY
jgi:hypothetical protein